ncbi:TrmB family transcriptional regulator [Sulfuracidifex tepidarius]|uniref:HTH-type sugar sensing transcriptional regulator TrmB n=1 Tax=Sulfuracidifex tepidarius TaxID=1294262 RepID=A0A510DW11_9CREN|nr:helix-turn-helix domain-containing protein [Sulfuracidifex tepidarius]BBG24210.1 HTH-type sugar sensing transcriptional regulator TrmB [Sulfuracidifex tepidarius]BBG26967.1 HTH-type sugar sensing transcriptional regulator TrmB [Sulfuracidifex tepidarius]
MSNQLLDEMISRISKFASIFGISRSELKVYAFLLLNGKSTARDTSEKLNMSYTKVYSILSRLEGRGWIVKIAKRPTLYEAVPVKEVWLNIKGIIAAKLEQLEKDFIEPLSAFTFSSPYTVIIIPSKDIISAMKEYLVEKSQKYFIAISYQELLTDPVLELIKADSTKGETRVILSKGVKFPDIPSIQMKTIDSMFGSGIITSSSMLLIVKSGESLIGLSSSHRYFVEIATVYFNYLWDLH